MKNLAIILPAIIFCALPLFAQQRWERTYGGSIDDRGYSVQQTSDGGYIVTGGSNSYGNLWQVYLIKTNASGDTLWTKTYGGTGWEEGYCVQQTSDNGYIVAGYADSYGNGQDIYLLKTDASGGTLWTKTYGGPGYDGAWAVQQTSDGGYIVAGSTDSYGNDIQVYLLKTNASGDFLWTKTYGGMGSEHGASVQETSDRGFIIAGYSSSFQDSLQVYLIKTNSFGDTLWTRNYGGTSYDEGKSVQQTSDGGYIITGETFSFGKSWQVYLVKTDASGDTLWTKNYGDTLNEYGYSVRQCSDGGYIIAGRTNSTTNRDKVYLIRTNTSGDTLWTRIYGGADWDCGESVRQTTDGGFIVAGYTASFGDRLQVYLIKTDANGNVGVEDNKGFEGPRVQGFKITPNPFISFARVPGHEAERFSLYDVSGRRVGIFRGDRVGEGLSPGVYFLKYQEMLKQVQHEEIVRIVKVR